jgi:hypothetical protein
MTFTVTVEVKLEVTLSTHSLSSYLTQIACGTILMNLLTTFACAIESIEKVIGIALDAGCLISGGLKASIAILDRRDEGTIDNTRLASTNN